MGTNETEGAGWFARQIDTTSRAQDAQLDAAMRLLAEAVTGTSDTCKETLSALEQIAVFFGVEKPRQAESALCCGEGGDVGTDRASRLTWLDEQLERMFAQAGVEHRLVELDGPWWRDAAGPMLAVDEQGAPVALIPKTRGYIYRDPRTGRPRRVGAARARLFGTRAFCFYRPLPARALCLRDIALYMLRCLEVRDVVFVLAALAASTALGMLLPLANAMLFGPVLNSADSSILLNACVLLMGVGAAQAVINMAKTLVVGGIGAKVTLQVQAAAMMRMLSLPASFFRGRAAGELADLLDGFAVIATQLERVVLGSALSSVFSLAYLGQIFVVSPDLGLPATIVVAANFAVSIATTAWQVKVNKRLVVLKARLRGWQSALLGAVRAIRESGAEKRAYATWAQRYADVARLTYNGPLPARLAGAAQLAVSLLGTVAVYAVAAGAHVGVDEYMAFSSAFGMVLGSFMALASTVDSAAQIRPRLDTLRPILDAVPESGGGKLVLAEPSGAIEMDDVTFGYDPDNPVLDGFSLKIAPGDYVAIVGASGCGKSTVMRLLLGFEKTQRGSVRFDGHDIETLDVRAMRRRIGVVLQDAQLFKGDLFSNITLCAPWLTEDDAWAAAEAAGIADDLRALPMGLGTVVGDGAAGFSGGQRQRLAIARALAPRPGILMFDEATSALDNRTQQVVTDTLDSLECTRIVIAHRISTIRACRRICMLQGGRIVEEGTYKELMARRGAFYELVSRQEL